MKLTPTLRAVVRALAAARGTKLAVGHVARDTRMSATTVRGALDVLERGRLVQHTLAPGQENRPARTVYWLTGDGLAVAAAGRPEVTETDRTGR